MEKLAELVGFLSGPNEQVQQIALQNLLPYSIGTAAKPYLFTNNDNEGVKAIRKILLSTNDPEVRKMALTTLVNLTDDPSVRELLASNPNDLSHFVSKITSASEPHAGLYCMLLANLAHDNGILALCGPNMDLLVFSMLKNAPMSAFDYLGFVFAETAKARKGSDYLSTKIDKLYPQLHSPSLTRRSGVAAAIKNILFDLKTHPILAASSLIENVMISLKGPEELDAEDTAKLPEKVKAIIGNHKVREPDMGQQLVLMEILLLLSSTAEGRQSLRDKQAYFVVRELHLAADDAEIKQACERFVNQVMRGEPEEPKIQELDEDEDEEIVEVA